MAPLFAALLETWQELNKYLEPMLRERPEETRAAFERAASRLSLLSTRDQYAWEGGNTTQVFELARQSLTRAIALAEGQSLPRSERASQRGQLSGAYPCICFMKESKSQ